MALDENSIKIDFKFDLKFVLMIDLKIELMTENSAFRNLAAPNWTLRNFGLMLFREYALSCKKFSCIHPSVQTSFVAMYFRVNQISWIRTFVQTIFVAMHVRANRISWICTLMQKFFGNMKFLVDGFRDYATLPNLSIQASIHVRQFKM